MGSEAMRQWGVGQKGKDNGAILFVFVGDRKMRIEVGYGLEGSLTDAKSKRITSTIIKPAFQRGDFNGGIEEGVNAILASVRGEAYRGTGKTVAQQNSNREELNAFLLGCLLPIVIIAMLGYLISRGTFRFSGGGSSGASDYGSWSVGGKSSSSSSSSSESSSSSDSFSGGGGSGGGGGASDSW